MCDARKVQFSQLPTVSYTEKMLVPVISVGSMATPEGFPLHCFVVNDEIIEDQQPGNLARQIKVLVNYVEEETEQVVTEDEGEELDEEEDRQFELTFGKDPCQKCPGCKSKMVFNNTNISINVVTGSYIINCTVCEARITIKNALNDRQRQFLHSNLKA